MLIGLVGKKGSGKTTVADYLVKRYDFAKYSFATPLKSIVYECFSLNDTHKLGLSESDVQRLQDSKTQNRIFSVLNKYLRSVSLPSLELSEVNDILEIITNDHDVCYRRLLQYIGTEVFRKRDPLFWVKLMFSVIISSDKSDIIIDDVRFRNEAQLIRYMNGYLVRIIASDSDITDAHASETEQDTIVCDCIIDNPKDGLEKLYESVETAIQTAVFDALAVK